MHNSSLPTQWEKMRCHRSAGGWWLVSGNPDGCYHCFCHHSYERIFIENHFWLSDEWLGPNAVNGERSNHIIILVLQYIYYIYMCARLLKLAYKAIEWALIRRLDNATHEIIIVIIYCVANQMIAKWENLESPSTHELTHSNWSAHMLPTSVVIIIIHPF